MGLSISLLGVITLQWKCSVTSTYTADFPTLNHLAQECACRVIVLLQCSGDLARTHALLLRLFAQQVEDLPARPCAPDLLGTAQEIPRALEKNYHTTRALLGKMVESGEVSRVGGRYTAL